MRTSLHTIVAAALVLLGGSWAQAQSAADGHWTGTVQVPGVTLPVEFDLARNADGAVIGTFGQPAQKLRGLPLSNVVVDGNGVSFTIPLTGTTFRGTVDANRTALSGEFSSSTLGKVPILLTRAGDPRFDPPPTSAAVGKELEGAWSGRLEADGGLRLRLKMSNQPNGTAVGSLVSVDQGGLDMPIAVAQKGSSVTIDVPMIASTYAGELNAAGTEIVGTFTTPQTAALPLTFRRAAPDDAKKD